MSDEDGILAGELALGLLDGAERAAALRLVIADPAFAREVERWRDRFAAWHRAWPEVAPGPGAEARAAGIGEAAPAPTPDRRWRWVAAAASAAAAMLLVAVVARPVRTRVVTVAAAPAPATAPLLVAALKPDGADPFSAVFDPRSREVRLSGAVVVPAGRDAELWVIGADGVPRAAGLLPARPAARLALARTLAIGTGSTFAISIEPAGGSPKPTPTGPVVATGKLLAI